MSKGKGCELCGWLEALGRSNTKRRLPSLPDTQVAGAGLIGSKRLRALLERDFGSHCNSGGHPFWKLNKW